MRCLRGTSARQSVLKACPKEADAAIDISGSTKLISLITAAIAGSFFVLLLIHLASPANAENIQIITDEYDHTGLTETQISDETQEFSNSNQQPPSISFGSYIYQVQTGDNLTYLTRRSIQLYVTEDNNMELGIPQVIAAETHVVQDLGAFELEVGQEVNIDVTLVAQYVKQASLLDEASKNRWATYAPIKESLDSIQPLAVPQSLEFEGMSDQTQITVETVDQTGTDEATNTDQTETTSSASTTITDIEEANAQDNSFSYMAVIGALLIVTIVVWMLALLFLHNPKEKDANVRWDKKKIKSKEQIKETITESKIAKKVKTVPATISKHKKRLKKSKPAAKTAAKKSTKAKKKRKKKK